MTQIIATVSNLMTASVFATSTWLFVDALAIRVEIKSLLKAIGFLLLTCAFVLNLVPTFSAVFQNQLTFWVQSLGLWFLFAAFILDSHSKLQFLIVAAIPVLIFLRSHSLLAAQTFLIAITIMQIAYHTKHKDLIPLITGFFLITIAEFFYSLEEQTMLGNLKTAADFLYIFASIVVFYWLWQYLVIRFNLQRKTAT